MLSYNTLSADNTGPAGDRGVAGPARPPPAPPPAAAPAATAPAPVARGWGDAAAFVAGIGLWRCSGALFVLIITFQLGIALAGVVGALVMGLGTALVTVLAAVLSVWAREGALSGLGLGRFAKALPVLEVGIGAIIALVALGLLIGSL